MIGRWGRGKGRERQKGQQTVAWQGVEEGRERKVGGRGSLVNSEEGGAEREVFREGEGREN